MRICLFPFPEGGSLILAARDFKKSWDAAFADLFTSPLVKSVFWDWSTCADSQGVSCAEDRLGHLFFFSPFLFPTQQSDLKMSSSVIICPRSWVTLAEHKELATFRLLWWHCTFLLKSSATFTKGRRASGWRCRRGYVKTHRVAEAKNGGFICCLDCDPAVSNRLTRASNWITPDFSVDHIDISARGGW